MCKNCVSVGENFSFFFRGKYFIYQKFYGIFFREGLERILGHAEVFVSQIFGKDLISKCFTNLGKLFSKVQNTFFIRLKFLSKLKEAFL